MFAGRIRTIIMEDDTKLAQSLFREDNDGAVIVLDGGGTMLGDINGDILADNGWAGIFINGVVRVLRAP